MVKRRDDITELLDKAGDDLDALLAAYRTRRLPALVDLIAIAGKRVAVEHPMTGSLNDQHLMWRGVVALKRSADVEWLIANVITGRAEYSLERIDKLETWPLDPRISTGLLALADGKRMTSRQARKFWTKVFRIVRQHEHPGLLAILAPMLAMQPQTEFEHRLLRDLRGLEVRLGKLVPPSPSSSELAVLAKLAERLEVSRHRAMQKTAEDFLGEIYAAPADDGPREVFADWLQERGDPRGELIALQLARHRKRAVAAARPTGKTVAGVTLRVTEPDEVETHKREKALLAKHRREWAAPFEPVLSMPNSTFERGFLHTVFVHWRKLASVPALMTHPAWSTVRVFRIDPEGQEACDVWIDHMLALGAKRG